MQFDYSSLKPLRDNIQNSLAPPTLTYTPIDSNKDGIPEQLNFTMRIKKPLPHLAVSQVNLIMAMDYELDGLIQMKMSGLANVNFEALASSKLSASNFKAQGHLNMRQPSALLQTERGKIREVYYDQYFDTLQKKSMHDFFKEYHTTRNETLQFDYETSVHYGEVEKSYVDI